MTPTRVRGALSWFLGATVVGTRIREIDPSPVALGEWDMQASLIRAMVGALAFLMLVPAVTRAQEAAPQAPVYRSKAR